MTKSTDKLSRSAKALRKSYQAGDPAAISRVAAIFPTAKDLKHADALHVIAREAGHDSWPKLKFAAESAAMDRAAKAERLKMALYLGQHWVAEALLAEVPDLGRDNLGLICALYDVEALKAALARDPGLASKGVGIRKPLLHLAFSHHVNGAGSEADMLRAAQMLVDAGADVDASFPFNGDENSPLSALYGAVGHVRNLALTRFLLEQGANPNDNESLYHSTEMGHREGLRLLLQYGARPGGTNALPRALDFNDHAAVQLLLDAGADPNEGITPAPSGEASFVIPALHQAARRMCDARMISMLLAAGADPSKPYGGVTPYAISRVYGNADAASLIAEAGGATQLSAEEKLLAAAADGDVPEGRYIDVNKLSEEYRNLIRAILALPRRMDHVKRLVAIGVEYDHPDGQGMTPVQIAGWEGLPEFVEYFLRLKPDLSHVNGYGGTLFSTILHGSENCPTRAERDHIGCMRLALEEGVALPKQALRHAGHAEMSAFLADWAAARPGQVVEEGVW